MDIIERKMNYLSTAAEIEIKNYIYNSEHKIYFKKIGAAQIFNTILKSINDLRKEKRVDQLLIDRLRLMVCNEFSSHLLYTLNNKLDTLSCVEELDWHLHDLRAKIINNAKMEYRILNPVPSYSDYDSDYSSCKCKDGDCNNKWWGDEESFEQWCSYED